MLLWRVRELAGGPAGVGRFRRSSDCLRSDAGILVSNVCGCVWVNRSLVHHVDDLAAEIRGGDSVVWNPYAGGGNHFAGAWSEVVTSAFPIFWRHGGVFYVGRRNFVFGTGGESGN